jgi:hypothetical protein
MSGLSAHPVVSSPRNVRSHRLTDLDIRLALGLVEMPGDHEPCDIIADQEFWYDDDADDWPDGYFDDPREEERLIEAADPAEPPEDPYDPRDWDQLLKYI